MVAFAKYLLPSKRPRAVQSPGPALPWQRSGFKCKRSSNKEWLPRHHTGRRASRAFSPREFTRQMQPLND